MISQIKQIVKNYLDNVCLSTYMVGTVVVDGIKVSDKLTIPSEMVVGNLKRTLISGNKVRLLRRYGGHEYYILEVITDGNA